MLIILNHWYICVLHIHANISMFSVFQTAVAGRQIAGQILKDTDQMETYFTDQCKLGCTAWMSQVNKYIFLQHIFFFLINAILSKIYFVYSFHIWDYNYFSSFPFSIVIVVFREFIIVTLIKFIFITGFIRGRMVSTRILTL